MPNYGDNIPVFPTGVINFPPVITPVEAGPPPDAQDTAASRLIQQLFQQRRIQESFAATLSLPATFSNVFTDISSDDEETEDSDEDSDDDELDSISIAEDIDFTPPPVRRGTPQSIVYVPIAPISKFSVIKQALKTITNSPDSSESYAYIHSLISSSAIVRHGVEWDVPEHKLKLQARYAKWISKVTRHNYIIDEVNNVGLVFTDNIYRTNSNRGSLLISWVTFENSCVNCAITGTTWLIDDTYDTDMGRISPTAHSERGYWHCDACNSEREAHEETCQRCAGRRVNMEIGRLYNYSDDVRNYIPNLFDIRSRKNKAGKKGTIVERPKAKLYFGLELEVVPREGVTQQDALYWISSSMKEHAIMKFDASLLGGGFEIVTAPATLEYHKTKLWNKLFEMKLPDPRGDKTPANLVKSWGTTCCGLHVHFTKAALTDMQLAKLLVFYHDAKNARFLSAIAGRVVGPNAAYCHQDKKKLHFKKDKNNRVIASTIMDCTGQSRHHEAVTISGRNGGKTVEVRIFKGNITHHGVMRSLEFVAATIEWCGSNGAKELDYTSFLKWFDSSSNRARYPDLWKHLLSLRFLGTRHKSKGKKVLEELPTSKKVA